MLFGRHGVARGRPRPLLRDATAYNTSLLATSARRSETVIDHEWKNFFLHSSSRRVHAHCCAFRCRSKSSEGGVSGRCESGPQAIEDRQRTQYRSVTLVAAPLLCNGWTALWVASSVLASVIQMTHLARGGAQSSGLISRTLRSQGISFWKFYRITRRARVSGHATAAMATLQLERKRLTKHQVGSLTNGSGSAKPVSQRLPKCLIVSVCKPEIQTAFQHTQLASCKQSQYARCCAAFRTLCLAAATILPFFFCAAAGLPLFSDLKCRRGPCNMQDIPSGPSGNQNLVHPHPT